MKSNNLDLEIAEYISTKHPNLKKIGPITDIHSADPNGASKYTGFKFENAKNKVQLLNDNFVHQIETNNIDMLYAFDAIQENVVNLKTDMLFELNISVDYIDADGD